MIIKIWVDRVGELGWTGERLATTEEYNEALNKALMLNPKYPRVEFLPLDRNETVQLQDGLFKVGEDLQLIPLPCPKN